MSVRRPDRKSLSSWRQARKRRRDASGLPLLRLILVLSSMSPLFAIWGIRGSSLTESYWFEITCAIAAVVPNVILVWRLLIAWRLGEIEEVAIGTVEDRRQDVLVYLVALVLPFYSADLGSFRELVAVALTISIITFLFWRLNLFYMNVVFAAFGYQVFAVHPPTTTNPLSGRSTKVLITWRSELPSAGTIRAHRLVGNILFEG